MSAPEKLPSGEALKNAERAKEKRGSYLNSKKNQKARAKFLLDGELTLEQINAERDRLKREFYEREARRNEA